MLVSEGGPGSGHRGHKGVKGRRGGSSPGVVQIGTVSKASRHVDRALKKLKKNKEFRNLTRVSRKFSSGHGRKGLWSVLRSKSRNVSEITADDIALYKICNQAARRSGYKGRLNKETAKNTMKFYKQLFQGREEWARSRRESKAQITKQAEQTTSKGILTPQAAFSYSLNREVAAKKYGSVATFYRGTKRGGAYFRDQVRALPGKGSTGVFETRSASSWTHSREMGKYFALSPSGERTGMLVRTDIRPRKDLIAYGSWWGKGEMSKHEKEVVPVSTRYRVRRVA